MSKRLPLLSTIANFDPRKVPIKPRDERYLSIAAASLEAHAMAKRLAPTLAKPDSCPHLPLNPLLKPSAVLIPLMQHPDGIRVLLTVRSTKLKKHSGQIALPGGKVDADDGTAANTALREAEEEIGLPRDNCRVIGSLHRHETGTGFEITPIVALVNPSFTACLSEDEVSDIFEVPLAHLMNPLSYHHHELTWTNDEGTHTRDWYSIPSLDANGQERFIWGVTARVLRHFFEFLHGDPTQ